MRLLNAYSAALTIRKMQPHVTQYLKHVMYNLVLADTRNTRPTIQSLNNKANIDTTIKRPINNYATELLNEPLNNSGVGPCTQLTPCLAPRQWSNHQSTTKQSTNESITTTDNNNNKNQKTKSNRSSHRHSNSNNNAKIATRTKTTTTKNWPDQHDFNQRDKEAKREGKAKATKQNQGQ